MKAIKLVLLAFLLIPASAHSIDYSYHHGGGAHTYHETPEAACAEAYDQMLIPAEYSDYDVVPTIFPDYKCEYFNPYQNLWKFVNIFGITCFGMDPSHPSYELCFPPPEECIDDAESYVGSGAGGDLYCSAGCEKKCGVDLGDGICIYEPVGHQCSPDGPYGSDCPQDYGDCPHPDHPPDEPPNEPDVPPDDPETYCERFPQSHYCVEDDDLADDEDNDSDDIDDGIVCTINGADCTDDIGDVICTINGENCLDDNDNPVCTVDGNNCLNDGGCGNSPEGCSGVAESCEGKPTCKGDPIQCAILNQVWYARCGGTHTDLGNCEVPLECTGDPLLCAQIIYDHEDYCSTQLTDAQKADSNNLANVIPEIDGGHTYRGGANVPGSEVDLTALESTLNAAGFGLSRTCITDISVSSPLADFVIPISVFCSLLQIAGAIVLIAGYFLAVKIVGEGI